MTKDWSYIFKFKIDIWTCIWFRKKNEVKWFDLILKVQKYLNIKFYGQTNISRNNFEIFFKFMDKDSNLVIDLKFKVNIWICIWCFSKI